MVILFLVAAINVIIMSGTKTSSVKTSNLPSLNNNAVWIQDNPGWLGVAPLSPTNMATTVATLARNDIKYAFLNIAVGDFSYITVGDYSVDFEETNATYQQFINSCHADGIDVLAWMENEIPLNLTHANWAALLRVYNSVLSIGFDGINSDIEQSYNSTIGTQQNFIDFNNKMSYDLGLEGKLWMPDINYFDSPIAQIGPYLHVSAEVIMFYTLYGNSPFDYPSNSSGGPAFWVEQFSPSPASPVILGIFCYYNNPNELYNDTYQFQQYAYYFCNYPPTPSLEGVSLWLYEHVNEYSANWAGFDTLINQFNGTLPTLTPNTG